MSDGDANDYDKLKKALLSSKPGKVSLKMATERDSGRSSQKTKKRQTSIICLKNYLAKWLEHAGSSPGNFDDLVDLIVKEQFINACSEELAITCSKEDPRTW